MKKKNMTILLFLSFTMLISTSFAANAQDNLEDYGVAPGDTFTYRIDTTIEGETEISFMKFSIYRTSTVTGLTADFTYYNGTEEIEETDAPCFWVIKQSEIEDYLETGYSTQQYHAEFFVDVIPITDNPNFSEIWVDIETGAAVKAYGEDEEGNSFMAQIAKWGDGRLQSLYDEAMYSREGGGGDLPGYPSLVIAIVSVFSIIYILKKHK